MAKKKESVYANWDDVDINLRRLGELEIRKTRLDGELTVKINELKEEYQSMTDEIQIRIKDIKKEITRFCEQNKESFLTKRNKKLNFGVVQYRLTERVTFISGAKAVIKALKSLNLDFCLRIKEEIDKDKIKELDPDILAKIGASVVKEDKLTIEPDIIKLAAEKSGA